MIKIKNIRKIPKYMLDKIRKYDLKDCPEQNGNTRFYKYFTEYRHELLQLETIARNGIASKLLFTE